jgi:hypothetical protein
MRIETTAGSLVPAQTINLPTTDVAPAGAPAGHTCRGDSIVGAVAAATGGDWDGTWSDQDGWSIDRIFAVDLSGSATKRWIPYINHRWVNNNPCEQVLGPYDDLLLYPKCTSNLIDFCFLGEPTWIFPYTAVAGPGERVRLQAYEVNTTFDSFGRGSSQVGPSPDATFATDSTYVGTDLYGYGVFTLYGNGPVAFSLYKGNRVPDHGSLCLTDGADGYCGTTKQDPVPFDPQDFCVTTGDDGECGTMDKRPPVGHITEPAQGGSFPVAKGVTMLKGTVDHDHSEIAQVQLRLKRQATVTITKYKRKRVTVKKRVRGKIKRVKVLRKKPYKVRVTRCYAWNVKTSTWALLKSCKVDPTQWFKADGDEAWSYEFLTKLPAGQYTLDAAAVDGVGNTDNVPEVGRNRITFAVK